MSFNINKKLLFIDSFQFLSSYLDNLVKILGKVFDSKVLNLVKQKRFLSWLVYEGFWNTKEKLSSNYQERFYRYLTSKELVINSMNLRRAYNFG